MHQVLKKCLANTRDDWFSPQRKMDILHFWRMRGCVGLPHGITGHEMLQWDALETAHGLKGLFVSRDDEPMTYLRAAPMPCIHLQARRGGDRTKIGQDSRVYEILDPLGFPITEPAHLSPGQRWLYHVARHLTLFGGLCTHADLANLLWPASMEELPGSKVVDVLIYKLNKKIFPERMQNLHGRGYKFVPAA